MSALGRSPALRAGGIRRRARAAAARLSPHPIPSLPLLVVLAAAACAASPALGAGGSAAGATRSPWCATRELRIRVLAVQGATSHSYWEIALRNAGARTCHMRGYPGVGLIDAQGAPIADEFARERGFPTPEVTLAHGQSAYFTFGYVVAGPCVPADFRAYGVEVYPPDDSARLLVHAHGVLEVCDRSVGGAPVVYPLSARRGP